MMKIKILEGEEYIVEVVEGRRIVLDKNTEGIFSVEHTKKYQKEWQLAHKEELLKYRLNHREEQKKRNEKYRLIHKEEWKKKYHENNWSNNKYLIGYDKEYKIKCKEEIKKKYPICEIEFNLTEVLTELPKRKKYTRLNYDKEQLKEYEKEYIKEYCKNNKEKISKYYSKRQRNLGFIPLNKPFNGSHGHHIDKEYVIYMPSKLHRSICHNVFTGKNMDKINDLAKQYLGNEF